MPSEVTIAATTGPLCGQEFAFDERTTCIVGRLEDCDLRIPLSESEKRTVSRHHCILDINPPDCPDPRFRQLERNVGQRP